MENTEVVFIKEVVCEAFCLEDTDLSKKWRNTCFVILLTMQHSTSMR